VSGSGPVVLPLGSVRGTGRFAHHDAWRYRVADMRERVGWLPVDIWRMIVRGGLIGGTASNCNSLGREESKMAATGTATSTEKGRRIVGAERQTLAKDLVKRYSTGESIRALAASTGRSYGFVHRVLTESGVQLRQRGGARRRRKA
jgi:hypothetical protein